VGAIVPDALAATAEHPHAHAVLSAALPPGGNASHAYLFHGPAGAGKREAAREFAAALLSDGAADPVAAARRARDGVHPDLGWVTPSGASEMLVGDVDEAVVAAAQRTPFEARRRVFVIERAETMNDQAANRMLKTLEEPPPFAHLVLLTSRPDQVLPTIASRCQQVRFEAPSIDALEQRLARHGVDPVSAAACARLSLGDAERALELALGEGPAIRARGEQVARAVIADDLVARPWEGLLAAAAARADVAMREVEERLTADLDLLPKKEQSRAKREATDAARRAQRRARTDSIDVALQLTGLWLRDVAVVVDGAPELVHHSDRADAVAEDAARFKTAAPLRAAVAAVDDTRFALHEVHATPELALEALAFGLVRTLS
jgi:DNA polymerase-3 subunit delta'